jgi:membrane associated rhomboid family serine protease
MWGIHIFQVVTGVDLGQLGIYPQRVFGLRGIIFTPLLHADWNHLFSNSVPFLVLTTMIMFFYRRVAVRSFIMIYLLTGFGVWIFGRPVFHIGASGVIYGLLAFVFWSGIFRRSLQAIVLSLIVTFLYSGYIMGILPNQEGGISWESHLIGGLVGIFTAYWYREEIEKDEEKKKPSWELEAEEHHSYFLDRDVFEKTKREREQAPHSPPDSGHWTSDNTFER